MELGLFGKRVLITGSHRGTGLVTAEAFAREGAVVFVHGLEAGQADPVAARLVAAGYDARALSGDPSQEAGADAVAAALGDEGVDVLVNNYGIAAPGRWDDEGTGSWIAMYERNVLSGVRLAKRLVPAMRRRGEGRVVFLGTVGSVRPRAAMPAYYAAKAALPAVVLSLAKELAGTGITVNAVSPGVLRTPEVEAHFRARAAKKGWGDDWAAIEERAIAETMGSGSAAKRLGDPTEVAAAVVFLAGRPAAYINGVDLRVDGGAADCVR